MLITLLTSYGEGYNSGPNTNVAQGACFTEGTQLRAERSKAKTCRDGCGRWPVGSLVKHLTPETRPAKCGKGEIDHNCVQRESLSDESEVRYIRLNVCA